MSTFQTRRQSSLLNKTPNRSNKTPQQQKFDEIIEKNRLIGKGGRLQEPPTVSSDDDETDYSEDTSENNASGEENGYYYEQDDDNSNEIDGLIDEEKNKTITDSTPLVITPDLKPFWIGVMLAMMIGIAMNMVCIWLIISSWDRNNNCNSIIDKLNVNIDNANSNNNSLCMTCSYDSESDEYTTYIKAIMQLDFNSEIVTQFDENGIIIDNVYFSQDGVSMNNVNTSILFENNLEASNMLISSQPGLISIPLETSSTLSTIGVCPSSDNIVPSIYAYKNIITSPTPSSEYYICFCNSNNKYCHILTQTV